MRKYIKEHIDPRYFKVCAYAGVTVILVAAILGILYFSGDFWTKLWGIFKAVISPIIIGCIICYLMTPLVKTIEEKLFGSRKGSWVKPASIALSFLAVAAIIALILIAVIITVDKSITNINMDYIKDFIASIQGDFSDIIKAAEDKISDIGLPVEKIGSIFTGLIGGVKNAVTGLIFGVIFAVYFLLDGARIGAYWKRAFYLIAGEKSMNRLSAFAKDADMAFSGYIRGQFLDAFIVGIVTSIAFIIAGIPSGLVVGILVGVGNMIPYVGPVVGYLALAAVCLLEWNIPKLILGAVILIVIMFLDGNVLNPRLLSRSIKVHPLLVVAALIGGGALGGLLGMIVAVPVAALISLQFGRYLNKKETEREMAGEAPAFTEQITEDGGEND